MPSVDSTQLLDEITALQKLAAKKAAEVEQAKSEKAKLEAQLEMLSEKLTSEIGIPWDKAEAAVEMLAQKAAEAAEAARAALEANE